MQARENPFYFMQATMCVEIPFFQRGYVWVEDNWSELLENLLDQNQSHFLGSIILKQERVAIGEVPRCLVIDGQQRLTTLSILLRACYDSLPPYKQDLQSSIKAVMQRMLFYREDELSSDWKIKIKHSLIDADNYKEIITGMKADNYNDIVLASEERNGKIKSSNILQCYKYFMLQLANNKDRCEKLWRTLTNEHNNIIVKIDLDCDENEQAIFDTVNSSGVRLTCADTIKNALFQKANENADSEKERQKVIQLYNTTWEKAFNSDNECIQFWNTERPLGRFMRSNQEILLHSIALIEGFYDPDKNKISDLSMLYKGYISTFDNHKLAEFIYEICDYAAIYRKYFLSFDKSTIFSFNDTIQRLFHVLNICDTSTFHPYILKLFKEYNLNDENLPDELLEKLHQVESYVIRHIVCKVTTKNFNKECALLLTGKISLKTELEKNNNINDIAVKNHLKNVNNKIASLILFWIELKRRYCDKKFDINELKYSFSLEHVMPQKWQEKWGIEELQVVSPDNGEKIEEDEEAERIRQDIVYEIGNMALINTRLNSSLRNNSFAKKIEGEGRKKGICKYADLDVTKEIITLYREGVQWNEKVIRERTEKLSNEFLEIW